MAAYDRLPNESAKSYARFWSFCGLGPGRSLQAAYTAYQQGSPPDRRNKNQEPTRVWYYERHEYDWDERALAWDVEQMQRSGKEAAVAYIQAVKLASEKALRALNRDIEPESFSDVIRCLQLLGSLFPPEVLSRLVAGETESITAYELPDESR